MMRPPRVKADEPMTLWRTKTGLQSDDELEGAPPSMRELCTKKRRRDGATLQSPRSPHNKEMWSISKVIISVKRLAPETPPSLALTLNVSYKKKDSKIRLYKQCWQLFSPDIGKGTNISLWDTQTHTHNKCDLCVCCRWSWSNDFFSEGELYI